MRRSEQGEIAAEPCRQRPRSCRPSAAAACRVTPEQRFLHRQPVKRAGHVQHQQQRRAGEEPGFMSVDNAIRTPGGAHGGDVRDARSSRMK